MSAVVSWEAGKRQNGLRRSWVRKPGKLWRRALWAGGKGEGGCGECVRVCPRNIMELVSRDQKVFVGCKSPDFGKAVKSVCKVGCIGCGLCANSKTTANEIITMDGKIPVIHYNKVTDPWK